ncbi:MAG: hypothetical protein ACE5IY_11295 [bacterium]
MDVAVILLLLAAFLIFFKLLGVLFKAGIFVLTLPLQIIGAVLGVVVLMVLVPFAMVAGVVATVLAPLLAVGPLLPFLLILLGVYLIGRHHS